MFPPNLQKNIQELERQISLLETECEHMEADKQETTPPGKTNSKSVIREFPNQPFITGPCISTSSYSSRMLNIPPPVPKIYSASCSHFRTNNEKLSKSVQDTRNTRSVVCSETKPSENESDGRTINEEERTTGKCPSSVHEENRNPRESTLDQSTTTSRETNKLNKRTIRSIQEVCESSDETFPLCLTMCSSKTVPKEQNWSKLFKERESDTRRQDGKVTKNVCHSIPESKPSSDEECGKGLVNEAGQSPTANWPKDDGQKSSRSKSSSKRRPRSARTKKKLADEIPMDMNITKSFLEKEIQCALFDEENEKGQFFCGLNESIKILHVLIGELKTKLSREKTNDVLNDMQETLTKISRIKSINSFSNPLISLTSVNNKTLLEGERNVLNVKNTLLALKQFCQELSDEKSTLTEEISIKNRALASFKAKEKEYLSLITSLKFNLEKLKEEAEEGAHVKRDLKILKVKLQEERKVIEALKKSHEKMQELIENYVLENDKLRAQVKIIKLESQKFNVLLAGKDEEINKYKKEIQSFQRQITQQLSLLRSKATENEVEQTIEAISNRRSILQADVESTIDPSEKEDFNENLDESTIGSSSTRTLAKGSAPSEAPGRPGWETQTNSSCDDGPKSEGPTKAEVATSNDSEVELNSTKRKFGLEKVLSSSKNLRSSINDLLADIRRESSEMHWMSPSDSCVTSSQSALNSTSSDEISERNHNN